MRLFCHERLIHNVKRMIENDTAHIRRHENFNHIYLYFIFVFLSKASENVPTGQLKLFALDFCVVVVLLPDVRVQHSQLVIHPKMSTILPTLFSYWLIPSLSVSFLILERCVLSFWYYCSSLLSVSQRQPGPHEVVFYSETEDSPGVMLWRYPEPRVLTFVRITPVPFNTTEDPEISTADLGDALQVKWVPISLDLIFF